MQFTINSKELKIAADRAMALIKARMPIQFYEYIRIHSGDDGRVCLTTNCMESSVTIFTDVFADESGEVCVHMENLKKICNMLGLISIRSTKDKTTVSNGKKRIEFVNKDIEWRDNSTAETGELLFEVGAEKMLEMLMMTDAARTKYDTVRPVLSGFNLNRERGRVTATDGFRMHSVFLDVRYANGSTRKFDLVIPGVVYPQLKKIISNNKGSQMDVYHTEKMIKFVGADFVYCARYIDGSFPDVYALIGNIKPTYRYNIDPTEVSKICKEYADIDSKFFIMRNSNSVCSAVEDAETGYRTTDIIAEVSEQNGLVENYAMVVNPNYLMDITKAYSNIDEPVEVFGEYHMPYGNGSCVSSMAFRAGNMEALLLPVRITDGNTMNRMREFVCA